MEPFERLSLLVTTITGRLKPIETKVGSASLNTTSKTLSGALNELLSLLSGKLSSGDAYTKTQVDAAFLGKQNTTDPLDASRLTGDIDPARIPVINYFKAYISTAATIAALSSTDQAKITNTGKSGTFNAVTLSDGSTYVYSGGTKTDAANYTLLTDVTPDWSMVANKPASVATAFADAATKANLGNRIDFVAQFNAEMA